MDNIFRRHKKPVTGGYEPDPFSSVGPAEVLNEDGVLVKRNATPGTPNWVREQNLAQNRDDDLQRSLGSTGIQDA